MKISWNNGYWSSAISQEIDSAILPCTRHCELGDSTPRKVAVIDASAGEYNPVTLCHECLVELANEVFEGEEK